MQATGVLFGQVLMVFGIVIAGVWTATQWTAAALGYQLRLGAPWFDFFGTPVYHPWRLFEWWFFFDAYAPDIFTKGGAIAGSSGLVAVVVAIGMSVWRSRQSRLVTTYGSARWADAADIRKARLAGPSGVFLGLHEGRYLRHDGPEHVLTVAPTRSGKGVGLVVPTLLSWPFSVVVHDIKGENWHLTAGWRSRFSHCLLFNPTDPRSAAYNPLLEVRRGAHEVRDVQNIADILVDPEGALERRNHWEKTSHALLVGAILHVLYAGEDKTLRGVASFLSDPACPFEVTLHRMMTTKHLGDGPHPVVASAAREVLNKSDNERSGVLSTAMSFLGLYRDPTVAEVTSRCDWSIADLIAAESPVSLYLVVPPSDISRTKPLIRLILNQIGRRLTESLDGSDGIPRRRDLLLMLDEFAALGRLDFFESALAFMAGYGLRAFLIAQSLNQIDKAYANVRQPIVSTLNLAHLMPVSAVWAGPERNAHLNGPPLIVTRTDGATPFRLVTHIGDVGHTLIVGPTGMGKSVLLATLAMQFRRYPGSRIFAFDMGRSMRATILGLGGEHYDLGTDGDIAFQPLARIDQESYRTWAAEWLEGRMLREGASIGPDEKAAIWSALESLVGAPVEQRTLTGFSVLLQNNALRQALAPYVLGGAHGSLLDADRDRLGTADVQGFEMEELMASRAAVLAVLGYTPQTVPFYGGD